jgi:hypothetical protein
LFIVKEREGELDFDLLPNPPPPTGFLLPGSSCRFPGVLLIIGFVG